MRPEPTSPRSAAQKLLRKLESQRRHLSYLLVAEQNRLEQLNDEKLRRLTCALMGTLKKQIALIDSRHRHFNHAGPRTLPKSPKAHQRQRRRRANRCTAASADARAGHAQSTGSCRSGGLGTFYPRQWHHAWQALDLRRTPGRTPRPLHGCTGGESSQSNPLKLLPASSHKRQTTQSCPHCRNAKTPPRPQSGLNSKPILHLNTRQLLQRYNLERSAFL